MVSGYPPRPSGGQHADEPAQPVQLQLLLSKVDLMAVQPTSQRHCKIDFKISFPCHWVRQLENHRKMVSFLAFIVYLCSLMIEAPFIAIWGFEATINSMFCTFEPFYGLEPFALLGCRWFHCLFWGASQPFCPLLAFCPEWAAVTFANRIKSHFVCCRKKAASDDPQ